MASLGQTALKLSSRRSRQSVDTARYLANHILLPPKLPQSLEEDGDNGTNEILNFVADAADVFAKHCSTSEATTGFLKTYLERVQCCHKPDGLDTDSVKGIIIALQPEEEESILLYLGAQNAAIIIHFGPGEKFIFEMFELSPTNESVMASQGALKRSFPGVAVQMPRDRLIDGAFLTHLVKCLGDLSSQQIDEFQRFTEKAGSKSVETRNTTDPTAVTDMLASLLMSIGAEVASSKLTKRTREDVHWDSCHIPWRRSPFWLALRVGIQRMLVSRIGQEYGFKVFKNFTALLVAQVCNCIGNQDLELAFHARAKLARRLYKLSQHDQLIESLEPFFEKVLSQVNTSLEAEWKGIRTSCSSVIPSIQPPQDNDLHLRLMHSKQTLINILDEDSTKHTAASCDFQSRPRETYDKKPFHGFTPNFPTENGIDRVLALSDFESWIKHESYNWDDQIVPSADDCQIAFDMFTYYLDAAQEQYSRNVDCQSIMFLTLLEIWAFMDRTAVRLIPLMRKFSPELPETFLRQLRVAELDDMKRANRIEEYVSRRTERSGPGNRSVFYSQAGASFSTSYYDSHEDEMRPLLRQIEQEMDGERRAKRTEWLRLRNQKSSLLERANSLSCTMRTDRDGDLRHGDSFRFCEKCSLKQQASALSILPIEERLPADLHQKKAVIFELKCPRAFKLWRDITWRLARDLGDNKRTHQTEKVCGRLQDYSKLWRHFIGSQGRFSLASTTESYLRTHYGSELSPDVEFNDLCKPHGSNWKLHDCKRGLWIGKISHSPELMKTYQGILPHGAGSESLQPTIISTSHSPNQVIAGQALCPNEMPLAEYNNFRLLRSGERTQWTNILVELAASHIDHNKLATSLLFTQAALQLGSREGNDPLRQSHWVFHDQNFCETLLNVLNERFNSIMGNWQEVFTLKTLLVLLLRLLSLGLHTSQRAAKIDLMNRMRLTLHSWTRSLLQKLNNTMDDQARSRLSQKLLQAALLCRLTYTNYNLLTKEERRDCGLKPFFECGILVASNAPIHLADALPEVAHDVLCEWKIARSMEEEAGTSITEDSESINCAIRRFWPGDYQLHAWKALPHPNERWFLSTATKKNSNVTQTVYFNVLDSQLLVDGEPLSALPAAYLQSPIYSRVFGELRFEVFPSSMTGMKYTASMTMQNQQIHFGWRANSLVIRSKLGDSVREFLPAETFGPRGDLDLPFSLICNKVHWLEVTGPQAGRILILPETKLWDLEGADWNVNVHRRIAKKQNVTLLEPSGPCARTISKTLEPLEQTQHIVVTRSDGKEVKATLPRLKLTFRLTPTDVLQCVELDASICKVQDMGTFYGLKNFLLLQHNKTRTKIIIVPKGDIRHKKREKHVSVWMDLDSSEQISYARFDVNSILGRLDCLGYEQDLLLMAHLHALTSHVLEDPLTERSGTEESMRVLQEFQRQQYRPLDDTSCSIVQAISALTPQRIFHPEHLRVMQTAQWDPELRASSQHEDFRLAAKEIVEHSDKIAQVCSVSKYARVEFGRHEELYTRARSRNLVYRKISEYFKPFEQISDDTYLSRDFHSKSLRCQRARELAGLVQSWDSRIQAAPEIGVSLQRLDSVVGFGQPLELPYYTDLLSRSLGSMWGHLYSKCRNSRRDRDYGEFTFLFGILAFANKVDVSLVKTLLATAFHLAARAPFPTEGSDYPNFQYRFSPKSSEFQEVLKNCDRTPNPPAAPTDESHLSQKNRDSLRESRRRTHNEQLKCSVGHAALSLARQWPCAEAETFESKGDRVDISKAIESLKKTWRKWYRDWKLSDFILNLQVALADLKPQPRWHWPDRMVTDTIFQQSQPIYSGVPSMGHIVREASLDIPASILELAHKTHDAALLTGRPTLEVSSNPESTSNQRRRLDDLEKLIEKFEQQGDRTRYEFGRDLRESLTALASYLYQTTGTNKPLESFSINDLNKSLRREQNHLDTMKKHLSGCLQNHEGFRWLSIGGLWPSITTISLLECLQARQMVELSSNQSHVLVQFALQVTEVQRCHRLVSHWQSGRTLAFNAEMSHNTSSRIWDTEKYPDWILLEVDSDMLLRKDQVSTAQHMINPEEDSNSVYQLQMGKGKSSFIVPACLCVLADGEKLARAIVTRPLLTQMARILGKSLCRLLGRSILHLPYSRSSSSCPDVTSLFRKMHEDTCRKGGVALCLPDHLLSFRLNGQQRLLDGRFDEAEAMLDTQAWFDNNCRDLMDESDHTLATRTQLIYPSGGQSSVDGGQNRWRTTQTLLRTVYVCVEKALKSNPDAIMRNPVRPSAFPLVHILRKEAEESLKAETLKEVCGPNSTIFQTSNFNEKTSEMFHKFLAGANMLEEDLARVKAALDHDSVNVNNFLLLRGLVGDNVVMLTLKKRWNVHYGLHLERPTLIAVPYQAKGKPSAASEFGHPDVAILLTLLAYYYTGLNQDQLLQTLTQVQYEQDPTLKWNDWIQWNNGLPDTLRSWKAVNLEDESQVARLWQALSHSVPLIDYFLDKLVFPKAAKEFESKLVSSSWDLPQAGACVTTGFSGTNGNSCHMPLSITQRQVPEEKHTNAEVLYFLLQDRNRDYIAAQDVQGNRLSVEDLIKLVTEQKPGIDVILDAGAQILEMDNKEVARCWLGMRDDAPAAVYFDTADDLQVIYRDDRVERLDASPYLSQLGQALLYLDEEHCRGTDLKLPPTARAALTLGLKQNKDHLVQAAMRMRQLGHSQSVVFLGAPEVHQAIIDHNRLKEDEVIDSSHVLNWSMEQSCAEIDLYRPLFLSQGYSFVRRESLMKRLPAADAVERRNLALQIKEREKFSLAELYGPREQMAVQDDDGNKTKTQMEIRLDEMARALKSRPQLGLASVNEEQERELEAEVEEERHVQRPAQVQPLCHSIHPDVRKFAEGQQLSHPSSGYGNAFDGLGSTSISWFQEDGDEQEIEPKVLATYDFESTVQLDQSERSNDYLRHVRYILVNEICDEILIISQFEANELLPVVRNSATSHLVVYDAAKSRQMVQRFGRFGFYSIPPLPAGWKLSSKTMFALGLFSGRQYFPWQEYELLRSWLQRLGQYQSEELEDRAVESPAQVPGRVREMLHELTSLRNYNAGLEETPMGFICRDRPLTHDHPGFDEK